MQAESLSRTQRISRCGRAFVPHHLGFHRNAQRLGGCFQIQVTVRTSMTTVHVLRTDGEELKAGRPRHIDEVRHVPHLEDRAGAFVIRQN